MLIENAPKRAKTKTQTKGKDEIPSFKFQKYLQWRH